MINSNSSSGYPNHNIDPALKDRAWYLKYARAMWNDSRTVNPSNAIGYHNAENYEKIDQYMTGDIPIDNFKKLLNHDSSNNFSPLSIDWTPRRLFSKFRDIALAKLLGKEANIVATPIDAISKNDIDDYYAEQKAKIALRDAFQKQGATDFAEGPQLARQGNEPSTYEELDIHMEYDYKSGLAMECEVVSDVIFNDNDIHTEEREVALSEAFDYGVCGYVDGHHNDGRVSARAVRIKRLITSYCEKKDFSDMVHWAEIVPTKISELAEKVDEQGNLIFSATDLERIKSISKTQYLRTPDTGANTPNKGAGENMVNVMHFEAYSWNTHVYRRDINPEGNFIFKDAKYENLNNPETYIQDGAVHKKYVSKRRQVVCQGCWIVDSDYIYDYGLQHNSKRSTNAKKASRTSLSLHLRAASLKNMKSYGIGERAIPVIDEYHTTLFKMMNLKNRMIPAGFDIDLDALEDVALSKGGKPMHPKQVLKFFFNTGILISRRRDVAGNQNANYKAVNVLENSIANDLAALWQDLDRIVQAMRDLTGLNELTDGSTPNAKTLVPVANMAYESTNNSLFMYGNCEKKARERLAGGVVLRLQSSLRRGNVYDGYQYAMGRETLKFLSISSDVGWREFAIKLEDKPTDEEKQLLIASFTEQKQKGLLTEDDFIFVLETKNMKQARKILAFKVKKALERLDQKEKENIQLNAQSQESAAIAIEKEKQKSLQEQMASEERKIKLQSDAKRQEQREKFLYDRYIKWMDAKAKAGEVPPEPADPLSYPSEIDTEGGEEMMPDPEAELNALADQGDEGEMVM